MSCTETDLKSYLQQIRRINSEIESEMTSIHKLLPEKYYNKPRRKIKSDKDINRYLEYLDEIVYLRSKLKKQIEKLVSCDSKISEGSLNKKFTDINIHRKNININPEDKLDSMCSSENKKGGCDKQICKEYEYSTCPESDFLNDYIIPYPFGKAIVFPLVIIGFIFGIIIFLIYKSNQNTKNTTQRAGPTIQF